MVALLGSEGEREEEDEDEDEDEDECEGRNGSDDREIEDERSGFDRCLDRRIDQRDRSRIVEHSSDWHVRSIASALGDQREERVVVSIDRRSEGQTVWH